MMRTYMIVFKNKSTEYIDAYGYYRRGKSWFFIKGHGEPDAEFHNVDGVYVA